MTQYARSRVSGADLQNIGAQGVRTRDAGDGNGGDGFVDGDGVRFQTGVRTEDSESSTYVNSVNGASSNGGSRSMSLVVLGGGGLVTFAYFLLG